MMFTESEREAIRYLRTLGEQKFALLVNALRREHEQVTLTNEQMRDPHELMRGQGRAHCIREIMQALMKD